MIASSQTFDKPLKKDNKPVSEIRHKFNAKETGMPMDMTVPDRRTCLAPEMHAALQIKYGLPGREEYEIEFNKLKKDYLARRKSTNATTITIPVIVHVVHNGEAIGSGANISAAQVNSQIEVLNEDFRRKSGTAGFNSHPEGADVEIEFALALRDETGNVLAEPGIHRVNGNASFWEQGDIENTLKPQTIWDPKEYMNAWTVNFGGDLDGILGYAQFPSLSGLEGIGNNGGLANTDGVVMGYKFFGRVGDLAESYDGGRTCTHEVGHWLGLKHIWGDGDCSEDDFCEDTPNAAHPNYKCSPINSCASSDEDMIENYMDYTPDACMNIFTQDQKERMRVVLESSPRRKELLTSDVHIGSDGRPIAFFSASQTEVCEGEIIDFSDNSLNSPTSWEWTFYDPGFEEIATFTDKNPSLVFNGIGVYALQLIVSNSSGSDTTFESNYISVLSSENLSLPFEESFEFEDELLDNWVLFNPDGDRTWQISGASSQGGSGSVFMDNFSEDDGDPTGNLDAFFSPKLDLSAYQDAYLMFDVAYAKYGGDYSDTLAIYVSSDCGEDFSPIWFKGGSDLATASTTQDSYVPSADEWITERISLNELNGISDVHLAFVNWSGWGNNLYIDNIKIVVPSYSTPTESFFYTPYDTISIGSTISLADYSTNFPTNWSWLFESGSPSASSKQNPRVTYNSIGSFDVELSTSNSSGGDRRNQPKFITVVPNPSIGSSTNRENNTICKGEDITITASGGWYYQWYDNRGYLVANEESLTVNPQETTSYKVIGFDRYGGSNSSSEEVLVSGPAFSLGTDQTIAIHDELQLDVGAEFLSYLWSDNSTGKTLLIEASDYGVGVHDLWVTVTDYDECQSTDYLMVTIKQSVGIIDLVENNSSIKVYPVPAKNYLNIESTNIQSQINCEIINSSGQCVKSFEVFSESEIVDISEFNPGYYSIRFFNETLDKSTLIIIAE